MATLLAATALGLVFLGLVGTGAAEVAAEDVLGQAIDATPDRVAFTTTEESEAQMFVGWINDLRREKGVDPLRPDPELELTATAWTTRMAQTGQLSHADDLSLGVRADWRKLGENVGVAPAAQLSELFEAFAASPTHLANMVDPSFDAIGIGVVHHDAKLWMTQRFMDLSPTDAGVQLG
jgi:uncharacterized protein YkwD